MGENTLTERRRAVLMALVNEYIASAAPVGSRTLAERYDLGFSSATVRSELASLEETGYLASPHTSSGRVPTDAAYRIFVDALLADGEALRPALELDDVEETADRTGDLVNSVCTSLSRATRCLSVVLMPSLAQLYLRRVSLVYLDSHQTLMVLVTQDAQVLNRHVSYSDEVDEERLSDIERLFNELFSGHGRDKVCNTAPEEVLRAAHDPLASVLFDALVSMLADHTTDLVRHLGVSMLLSQPEFKDPSQVMPLVMLLENDATLVGLLDELETDDALIVRIGHEISDESLHGFSIVLKGYASDGVRGVVSVIGPTRMNYAKAIPAVSRASQMFEEVL
ncbi:MAG: heat-inducible transcriptional repressor HrcA [Coriobacteriales bacterium]